MHSSEIDSAGVLAPPPVLFAAGWVLAAALHRVHPIALTRRGGRRRRLAGAAFAATGLVLSALVVRRFEAASTPVSPLRASRALVVDGPYRYTRNPDYLGQTLVYAGASMMANRLWPLLLLPAVLAVVNETVVDREERYLTRLFGTAYTEYARRVPRWF
jgi:protein-S-isoprenylcysteine O-methyltransferase Ste14